MSTKTLQWTRQELYDLVWSKPMRTLAQDYGISDTGLSKICKRHRIPTPPPGYWQKLRHGYAVKQPPLPPLRQDQPDLVEAVVPTVEPADAAHDQMGGEFELHWSGDHVWRFPQSMSEVRPVLVQTMKHLQHEKCDHYGRLYSNQPGLVTISVSPDSLVRAIYFLEGLFSLLEGFGFFIEISTQQPKTFVVIAGERVEVRLIERAQVCNRVETGWGFTSQEYSASGTLCLQTLNVNFVATDVVADKPSKKIENRIDEVPSLLARAAFKVRMHRLQMEAWQAEKEAKVQSQKENEKREEALSRLVKDASDWQSARLIRDYITAAKARRAEMSESFDKWAAWALSIADKMDPLKGNPLTRFEEFDLFK